MHRHDTNDWHRALCICICIYTVCALCRRIYSRGTDRHGSDSDTTMIQTTIGRAREVILKGKFGKQNAEKENQSMKTVKRERSHLLCRRSTERVSIRKSEFCESSNFLLFIFRFRERVELLLLLSACVHTWKKNGGVDQKIFTRYAYYLVYNKNCGQPLK